VFGDPNETGKPAGDDLREGKRTVLMAIAVERSTEQQAAVLRRHLGDPGLDENGVAALREIITETGALDRTEELISERLCEALTSLDTADLDAEAKAVLVGLAHAATSRTT